jgi:hypothetical protein
VVPVKRRLFLKGVAGAAVATPFLSSLERPVRAGAPEAPRRLVIFYTTAGCLTNRWFPKVEHGPIDATALSGTTLEGLSPFARKLLFPRGLAMFPRGVVAVNGASYFDPHDQGMGSKLTAAPIDPSGQHWALGRSLDHVAADFVNQAGTGALVLSVGRSFQNVKGVVSYTGPREPHAPVTDPTSVYGSLTGVRAGGTPVTEADYRVARGKSIIDLVRSDLEALRRHDLSRNDQQKVTDWLALLRETEQGICILNATARLGITESALIAASGEDNATAFTLGGDMMMKLIALTMMCDANRSVILQWPGYVTFNWDGISHAHDHQALSHRNGSAAVGGNCIDGVLGMLRQIDTWYAGRYAKLVGLIDGISEGDRTMLDNSAVMWLPELADGSAHNNNNLPIVIAGSSGGYLKQAISVNLEGQSLGTGDSEAHCAVDGDQIELDTGSAGGNVPLNKLYVTLLNALGATNGGSPIETFGQVDSNELAAGITNPGELDALRA